MGYNDYNNIHYACVEPAQWLNIGKNHWGEEKDYNRPGSLERKKRSDFQFSGYFYLNLIIVESNTFHSVILKVLKYLFYIVDKCRYYILCLL